MYSSILNNLQNYMLIGKNLNCDTYSTQFKPYTQNTKDIYDIRQHDSLFWSFYILTNGIASYEMNASRRYFTIEQQEKFKYVELIRKNKQLLKNNKFKNLLELESDLGNNPKINIKIFFALCLLENIKFILVDKRKIYFNASYEELVRNENVHIILKNNKYGNYSIDHDVTEEKIKQYLDNYLHMDSYDDKLKSISSYKMPELVEMCQKLNIHLENEDGNNKKLTKQQLYSILTENY